MTMNHKHEIPDPIRKSIETFVDKLFDTSYTPLVTLSGDAYASKEPLSFEERFSGKRLDLSEGSKWAEEPFDCAWFHLKGELPRGYSLSELVLLLDCGGEGLVYDTEGGIRQGITCYSSDFCEALGMPVKRVVRLDEGLCPGGRVDIWLDCGANDLFGNMIDESRACELRVARINPEIRGLAYDMQSLLAVYDGGDDKEFNKEIFHCISEIAKTEVVDEKTASLLREKLRPLLEQKNETNDFTYYAVGHAHLDLAWLWPLREGKRKGARTFASQIKNIELYPDYVFGASQAQLYKWVKDGYPELFKKVQALAETPNWDVQGATWVEMDSNLIGSESMVRQFFYGKRFFKQEFGKEMKIFWVPDSFGYSACLPQVMKLANVPYFLTQKISWNIYNKFPYHSFNWQGLDGTGVLAHMLPEDTYNAPMRADYLVSGEKNYAEREISNISMSLYGIGDGGAGPGYEHIERLMRYKNLRSVPKVKPAKHEEFFERFDNPQINYPTHRGELYLERHQGTYTTRADNKRYNRKCELALRNYEMLMPLAKEKNIDAPIDHSELESLWKEILLYQFHDILPGSSINRVYEETSKHYPAILRKLRNSAEHIVDSIFPKKTVVNFNSFAYDTKLKLEGSWYNIKVPALGAFSPSEADRVTEFSAEFGYNYIENDCVKVTFDGGVISSLFDKRTGREAVMAGKRMGVISQYTDKGDCWDMPHSNASYLQTRRDAQCQSFDTYKDGARAVAKASYKVGNCTMSQEFSIIDGDSAVYVKLHMDVKQQDEMLRIEFPVSVKTEEASFNLQFGHIKRRTTENNSVEVAQFEVSGQKFVDMSEKDFGVSLLNDCKYGYRCKHGIIDMNLVRSPGGGPGENVDQGEHEVNYAILLHEGQLDEKTYALAYKVNNPLYVTKGEIGCGCTKAPYSTTNEAIILETVKEPEDREGLILRLYNCRETEQTTEISLEGYRITEIVDIMENKLQDKTDGRLTLHGFGLVNVFAVKC